MRYCTQNQKQNKMTRFEELQKLIFTAKKNQELILTICIKNTIERNELSNKEIVLILEDLIYYKRFLSK